MSKPVKILFLASNPCDPGRLRLDKEFRNIDEALRKTEFRDQFEIVQHWAVRVHDLQEYLQRHQPDIVHFSGHGGEPEGIVLEADNGASHPVATSALHELFELLKDNIRCVVLNACYSDGQAKAIAKHIDCVVGMSKDIGDEAAIAFATAFYRGLGYGRDLKNAFALGHNAIDLENLNEQDTPKLHVREGIDPQKIFFASHEPETAIKKRYDFYQQISLPPNYIPREELLAELRAALFSSDNALALTSAKAKPTALHGMGGIGKSVMARALCEDMQMREAFPQGILWTTLGQEPNLAEKLREWIHALGGVISQNAPTLDELKDNLNKLLDGRQCLLVVDDVWRKTHAETFRVGNQSRLLLTTRDAEVAAELGATVQPVPLMTREEAVCLLEEWADGNLREVDKGLKARIVERLGRLPLALRLAGAQLRSCEPNSWLATFDVYRLNAKRIEGVHDSLVATFELSLKELKETQRQLYTSLAIFKEGESIPETALHKLWSGLAEFDATQTAELLEDLASRALLTLENTATPRCANLHDLLRDFIASKLNAESRRDTHLRLLQAYRLTCRGMGWHTAPDDGYLYSHLAYHLKHAQQWDDVHTLFKDQNWMHTRVPQCNYDYDGYLSDLMIAWENAHKRTQEQIAADKMPTALAACVRYALIRTSVNSLAANYPPELVARAVAIGLWPPQRALSLAVKVLDPRQRARFFVALLTIDQLDYDTYTFVKQQALNAACAIRNEIDRGQLLTVLSWQLQGEEREQVLRERRVEVGVYEEKRTIGPLIQQLTGDELRRELTAALAIENDEEYRVNLLSLLVPQLTEKDLLEELATVRAIEDDDFFAEVTMALAPLLRNENSQEWLASTLAIQDKYYRVQALAALLPTLKNKKREEMLRVALEAARAIEKGDESRAQALATLALHLMDEERRLVVHEVLEEIWEIPDGWCRAQVLVSVAPLLTGENLRDELETMIKAKSPETHALTLAILASQLMDKDREQAVREVMDEVWVIETEKEWYRAQVLVAVAPLLTGESLHEGLNAARTIKDTRLHLRALAALVSRLTNGERNQVVREVLERVWAIENDWDRVPVFEAVAPFLVDENLHEGLKVALAIEDERARIQVLAALAPSLPRKQVYETLLEFVESSLNKERSEVLQLCARRNFFTPTSLSTEIFNAIAKHIIEICRKWQWQ